MDPLDALTAARANFDRTIRQVGPDDLASPTPCEGWSVRDLLQHVIGANLMAARLAGGARKADVLLIFTDDQVGSDPVTAWVASADAQDAGLRRPGVLEQIVHHPAFDMPGAQLLAFRTGDLLLHSWDLARAIGADETLDEACATHVLGNMLPMAEIIPSTGQFGAGPTGAVADDAPVQQRLLDLTGRRP
jgi:uncharacterized protein (TIGR03086 family)